MITVVNPAHHVVRRPLYAHYERLYHEVAHRFGERAPGRNIVALDHPARTEVLRSIGILGRMLRPVGASSTSYASATVSYTTETVSAPVSSSLESCIIQHESGGNSDAVSPSGTYAGIGQWSATAWAEDGGDVYGASPLDASYAEQEAVLAGEGAAGMEDQQGQFDGC